MEERKSYGFGTIECVNDNKNSIFLIDRVSLIVKKLLFRIIQTDYSGSVPEYFAYQVDLEVLRVNPFSILTTQTLSYILIKKRLINITKMCTLTIQKEIIRLQD